MDSHDYGQQPGFSPPSGLPVPPHGEVAQPAQPWAQPAAPTQPSGLPAQSAQPWAQPTAAAEPYGQPPAADPAFGQPPAAGQAFGQPPAAGQAFGQPPAAGQAYEAALAATPRYGRPPATDPAYGPTISAFSAYGQNPPAYEPAPAAVQPYGQGPAAPQAFEAAGMAYGQPAGLGQPAAAPQPFGQPPVGGMPYGQMPPGAGEGWPPYLVQPPAAPGSYAPRRGPGRKIAVIAAAAVVVLGGASAFAADAWAKGQVCEAVQSLTDGFTSGGSDGRDDAAMPSSAEFDKAEDGLNGRARLLFFHGDLKEATHGLADDIASIKHLTQADPGDADVTEMLTVAVSIDSHARKAQRACGLPEKGLLGRPA